jgi:hypothetical protein
LSSYTFTEIADESVVGGTINNPGPSINNLGQVAFATLSGVFLSNNVGLSKLASASGDVIIHDFAAVNDYGQVAFKVSLRSTEAGHSVYNDAIWRAEQGGVTEIANSRSIPFFSLADNSLSINKNGTITFEAFGLAAEAILAGNGNTLDTVFTDNSALNDLGRITSINDAGMVAFQFDTGAYESIYVSYLGNTRSVATSIYAIFLGKINNIGAVAYNPFNGGVVVTGGTTIGSEAFRSFQVPNDGPSVNDKGDVAFWASLLSGGQGIFIGADPVANKVIATGDALFGSTVTNVAFSRGGLNNSGEIAFGVSLADHRHLIVRATPNSLLDIVPTSLVWNTTQGGVDFSYKVKGPALTQDTTAQLYWASGTTTDTILEPATTPITISQFTPLDQEQTVHLTPTDFTGAPPSGANYLLAVVDPSNLIQETDETNNAVAIVYDPKISVTAKYDGDPSDAIMGRYFSGTDALKDNFYTLHLSDSLDALRPQVEVKVIGQTLKATISSTDPHNYLTGMFDPGSLAQEFTPLQGEAIIGTADIADASASIQVEPLPQWMQGLRNLPLTFDPNGDGSGGAGAYVFDGFLPNLSLGETLFTIPSNVPLIGGKPLGYDAGIEANTIAPLAISSTPTLKVGFQADLTLGDAITLPVFKLEPTKTGQISKNWTFSVTSGATLDPITLNSANGAFVTLAFDTISPLSLTATLFQASTVVLPFGVPTVLQFDITAALAVMLHAHAQIAYDASQGLEFLSGGTYLNAGLQGSVTATGEAGWFAPAWVQRILGRFIPTFSGVTLALRDKATLTLNENAEEHFGGTLTTFGPTGHLFNGNATFSDKLDVVFEIGNLEIFNLIIADLTKPIYQW